MRTIFAVGRSEDFSHGLENWSTHLYYRSHSGGCRGAGHCAWNRRTGAKLMPSPDGSWREALLIGRHPDDRLFSDREGAVWNFPGCRRGILDADLTLAPDSAGIRISHVGCWINPRDEYVREYTTFSAVLDGDGCLNGVRLAEPGKRFTLHLEFDLDTRQLKLSTEQGKTSLGSELALSYLHLQTAAEKAAPAGVYLHCVTMKKG